MTLDIITIYQFAPAKDLQLLAFFSKQSFEVKNVSYPRFALGELPQVSIGSSIANGTRAIALLKSLDKDSVLYSEQQKAAIVTLESLLISGTLSDVSAWARLHSQICTVSTARSTYSPLSYFVPRVHDESIAKQLASRGFVDEDFCKFKAFEAYKAIEMAYNNKDENNTFFFGPNPCSLDAVLFGHLDAIRQTRAGDWVKEAAPSLIRYYSRLRNMYFKDNSPFAIATVEGCNIVKGSRANAFAELETALDDVRKLNEIAVESDNFHFGESLPNVITQAIVKHSKSNALTNVTFEEVAINLTVAFIGVTSAVALYFLSLRR